MRFDLFILVYLARLEDAFEFLEQTDVYLERIEHLSELLLACLVLLYFLSFLGTPEADCVADAYAFSVEPKFYSVDAIS